MSSAPYGERGAPASGRIGTFEEILTVIKPLGRWQLAVYAMLAYSQFWDAMINITPVFMKAPMDFECRGGEGAWHNLTRVYGVDDALRPNITGTDACYSYNHTALLSFYPELNGTVPEGAAECTGGYEFDRLNGQMKESIISQLSLVCDRRLMFGVSQSVYMAGFLVGSICAGLVADFFGRKWAAIAILTGEWAFGILQAFVPNYWSFVVVRFLLAFCVIGSWMCQASLGAEITSSRYRTWVGGLMFIPYALGYSATALLAYATRHWVWTQFWSSVPLILGIVLYVFFLPESPRWQLSKGRVAQAERTLAAAARCNGAPLPAGFDMHAVAENIAKSEAGESARKETLLHIFAVDRQSKLWFKYPHMIVRTAVLFVSWFVCSMVYYGVSFNITDFAGDIFVNNGISGLIEIPANLLAAALLYWGRKRGMFLTLAVAGVTLFPIPFIASGHWLQLVLVFAGKFAITAAFTIIYVYTLELYPTVMRASGLSACSCFARVGSILAPMLNALGTIDKSYKYVPSLIFGAVSLVAAALVLLLPETKGRRMAEYLEDTKVLHMDTSVKIAPADREAATRTFDVTGGGKGVDQIDTTQF